jgi:alkylresorcinol/alkylpyrone synthase
MAKIISVATAVPDHVVGIDDVRRLVPRVFGARHDVDRLLEIVERAGIESRRLVDPVERTLERRTLGERNDRYIACSRELGERALVAALEHADLGPRDVDLIVTTSCTGFAIPSIDAWLANRLGMRTDVRRLPITELGCAGGAAGLARAADFIRAYPDATAAVLAVELPSLTFQPQDDAMANVVSSFLFGDGAAAVVLSGRRSSRPGARVLASRSALFPGTLDLMGFDLKNTGFHIVLSPAIPLVVERRLADELAPLLDGAGVTPRDLDFFVLHPGGTRVLESLAEALAVAPERLAGSRRVLARHGNLSSASVLFVYRDFLDQGPLPEPGAKGLLAAFGPGFACEMLLLEWVSS